MSNTKPALLPEGETSEITLRLVHEWGQLKESKHPSDKAAMLRALDSSRHDAIKITNEVFAPTKLTIEDVMAARALIVEYWRPPLNS